MSLFIAPDAHIRQNPMGQLGQAVGGGISSKIQSMLEKKENQKALDALRPLMIESGLDEDITNQILQTGAPASFISQQLQNRNKMLIENNKLAARDQKLQGRDKEQAQDVFNKLTEFATQDERLIGNRTPATPGLSKESRAARSEFDTLSSSLLGDLIEGMKLRGTISDRKFKLLQSLIPKSNDSRTKIKGKLRALGRELGLDFSSLDQAQENKSESKEVEKFSPGQSFESLPNASEFPPNSIVKDSKTGERYQSNGKSWKKLGK